MEAGSVIDSAARIEGTLKGHDAQIRGRFNGEIEIDGRLVIAEGANVEAKVKAVSAEIGGVYKGDLVAQNLLILEKGRVDGTITAQRLSVREGAIVNAAVSAGAAPAPAAAPAVAAKGVPDSKAKA